MPVGGGRPPTEGPGGWVHAPPWATAAAMGPGAVRRARGGHPHRLGPPPPPPPWGPGRGAGVWRGGRGGGGKDRLGRGHTQMLDKVPAD